MVAIKPIQPTKRLFPVAFWVLGTVLLLCITAQLFVSTPLNSMMPGIPKDRWDFFPSTQPLNMDSLNRLDSWNCTRTCCVSDNVANIFFKGQFGRSPALIDMLSPIDNKAIADVHFGTLPQPDEQKAQIIKLIRNIIPCLQDGAVIFVDHGNVDQFIKDMLPHIKVRFVLMSGDADDPNPEPSSWNNLSQDPRLIHWFLMNYQGLPNHQNSSLATALPLGNSQWNQQKENLIKVLNQGYGLVNGTGLPLDKKNSSEKLIFASFTVGSNPAARQPIWNMACDPSGRLANISTCIKGLGQEEFYKRLAGFKFALSPHGAGLDCYRTWESLLLGVFPIVQTSSLDTEYEDLPVLIVQKWEDINETLLLQTYERFSKMKFKFEKLYKGYWFDRVRSFGYKPHKYLGIATNS